MNVLITGGAGFIGSHLADSLLAEGHDVVVVDDLSLGRKENIKQALTHDNFMFYHQDINNFPELLKIFAQHSFDAVFHMAANSDIAQSHANPDIDKEKTFLTTYNTLLAMKEFHVKKIIFASTSAVYGDTSEKKVDEDFGPLFPVSHYGAAKLASEGFISSFAENYGFQAWIARFPNVVGERATHGAIFDFINRLRQNPHELHVLGDGMQFKPYLYVRDLVDALLLIWKNSREKINYYNIGVDSRTRVKEIAEMVVEEMGLSARIVYGAEHRGWIGDVPQFDYSLTKIHALGWKARNTSNEAVRKAIRHILEKSRCN